MDDIKDPSGKDPIFDETPVPPPKESPKSVGPESEERGSREISEDDTEEQ